jgi:hypothetical protein
MNQKNRKNELYTKTLAAKRKNKIKKKETEILVGCDENNPTYYYSTLL